MALCIRLRQVWKFDVLSSVLVIWHTATIGVLFNDNVMFLVSCAHRPTATVIFLAAKPRVTDIINTTMNGEKNLSSELQLTFALSHPKVT